jgi:hypothetical protein
MLPTTQSFSKETKGPSTPTSPTDAKQPYLFGTRRNVFSVAFAVLLGLITHSLFSSKSHTNMLLSSAQLNSIANTAQPSDASKPQQQQQFYSELRYDRSGSKVLDMLFAHAYAFANGMQYMGACGPALEADQKLLNVLGLSSTLPLACPPGNTSNRVILNATTYHTKPSHIFDEQWLKYIRSAVRCTKPESEDGDNVTQVVVHIRRGDVNPCVKSPVRYTPNSQYMDVLEQYLPHNDDSDTLRKVRVSIFSEKQSHESFDVFAEKNYSLFLDTDLVDVWRALVTADVVVMAKSGFSYVPTLLNGKAKVWYDPFWHGPVPGWQRVSKEILEKSSADLRKIQEQMHCD